MNAVEFDRVSKNYAIYDDSAQRLLELATLGIAGRHRDFHALTDVTFSIGRGEVFCIIGENGSGKSTALQMIAGIFAPTSGRVTVNGRVSALLELGSGFNPQFTGRENIYMNGAILGLTKKQLDRRFDAIADFAEIGDFIHQPVRTYSSGMTVRLAFSVAIHIDPEILVVDEALAVGDAWFRQRCMRRINEMKDRGTTIVFVSHSAADVHAIGDTALWLDHGKVRATGDADAVVTQYLAAVAGSDSVKEERNPVRSEPDGGFSGVTASGEPHPVRPADAIPNIDHRSGDGSASILGIAVLDEFGDPLHLMIPRSRIVVRITVRANRNLRRPNIGVRLRNHLGLEFAATSTDREGHPARAMNAGDTVTVDFHFELPELYPGAFSFSPWAGEEFAEHAEDPDNRHIPRDDGRRDNIVCDAIDNAVTMQMARGEAPVYGYIQVPCRIEVSPHGSFAREMGSN